MIYLIKSCLVYVVFAGEYKNNEEKSIRIIEQQLHVVNCCNFNLNKVNTLEILQYGNSSIDSGQDFEIKERAESSSYNSMFNFLDKMDNFVSIEALEEMNNCELKILNLQDIEDFFRKIESEKKRISNDFINLSDIKKHKQNKYSKLNERCLCNFNLIERRDNLVTKYMQPQKNGIVNYIKHFINRLSIPHYTFRLKSIERGFNIVDPNVFQRKNSFSPLSTRDYELLKGLKFLHMKFGKKNVFDSKTCKEFNEAFDLQFSLKVKEILSTQKSNIFSKHEKLYFYLEMVKIFKYVDKMPELLTLNGLYRERQFYDLLLIYHLINMFIENIGNFKEDKVFILCMIHKAFSVSYRQRIDLFQFPKYRLLCSKGHNNLHFFFWEMHRAKRVDMKRRVKCLGENLDLREADLVHLKAILLIYVYQHIEFLIYYNFKEEVVDKFSKFVVKVLKSDECFACYFDEYLKRATEHIDILCEFSKDN